MMKVYKVTAPTPQGSALRGEQAFLKALEFHEAALRSAERKLDANGAPITALCPMIVCFAFAVELYLKSLIKQKAAGHDLHLLFQRLSSPVRRRVQDTYEERTGRNHRTLEGDLEQMAHAFSEWRYVFEGEGQQIHTNLLIALAKAVLYTIKSINFDWTSDARIERQIARLLAEEAGSSMTVVNLGGGTFLHLTDGTGGTLNSRNS